MAIKITSADSAFSKCVRERAGWKCERCGKYFPEGEARRGLDCSHHHSRRNWAIRFDPLAAESLCYGCHSHVGGTQSRREEVLTDTEQEFLFERIRDIGLAKMYRKTDGKGPIAKHFRDELARMKKLRKEGVTGRIEFEAYL